MAFRVIETGDLAHLRWKSDFSDDALIIAYHFPEHDAVEPLHDHDFVEIQLCAGGRGRQQTQGGDFPFTRGKAMLIRPGAWHRHHDNERLDAYVCCFGAKLLMHELLWTLDEPALNELLWRPSTTKDGGICTVTLSESQLARCIVHFEALVALGESEDPREKALRLGYLTLILATLAEAVPERVDDAHYPPAHTSVKRCLTLMGGDLAESWTANGLARKLNIDVSYLGRLFKSTLGMSPMAWLAQARAERAARLLCRTDKSVSEIAIEVGWPDPVHFARRFRAHFGVSATEYRERRRARVAESTAHPEERFRWAVPERDSIDGKAAADARHLSLAEA